MARYASAYSGFAMYFLAKPYIFVYIERFLLGWLIFAQKQGVSYYSVAALVIFRPEYTVR